MLDGGCESGKSEISQNPHWEMHPKPHVSPSFDLQPGFNRNNMTWKAARLDPHIVTSSSN